MRFPLTNGLTVLIANEGVPHSEAALAARVARMRRMLDDPDARFSGSAALAELNALRAYAGERHDLVAERCEILSMIGTIVSRSAATDRTVGLEAFAALMTLGEADMRPAARRMLDHYIYAELAGIQAALPGEAERHSVAADQYGQAAVLADELPEYDDDQRAATREKQAYHLHEAERYAEALAVNSDVLASGERLFGTDDPRLRAVLTNLAQNLYRLGRKAEAEPYLVRVQAIAEAGADLSTLQDVLFQRGVLNYELGRAGTAIALMRDRIERLEAAGDAEVLAVAKRDYDELKRRLRSG